MDEKWKFVTIEIDEEEEYPQDITIVEEEEKSMEVDTHPTHSVTILPTYVAPAKREGQSALGPGRNQEFTPNPAPPRRHCV